MGPTPHGLPNGCAPMGVPDSVGFGPSEPCNEQPKKPLFSPMFCLFLMNELSEFTQIHPVVY